MKLKEFAGAFQIEFDRYLDGKINTTKPILQDLNKYAEYIKTVSQKGKKIRPYNVYQVLKGYRTEHTQISKFTMAFELAHSMALIQDDWMDHATTRRGVPTYHVHFKKDFDNEHIADVLAVLAGDLCFARAYECINEEVQGVAKQHHERAKQQFFEMIEQVLLGQMLDIHMTSGKETTIEQVKNKSYYKTASYTFTKPLLAGAALAGIEEGEERDAIKEMGDSLGVAYQIRDDLKDMVNQHTDKDTFKDIEEGQQTLFTQFVFDNGTQEQKAFLRSIMGTSLGIAQKQELTSIMDEVGAFDYGRKEIGNYLDRAANALERLSFDEETKQDFRDIITLFRN